MEGNKTTERITDKKMDGYGSDLNNFVGEKELLVTITLNEYRELVSEVAKKKKDIDEIRDAKWKAEAENKNLKKEVEELRMKINELLLKYDYTTISHCKGVDVNA